MTDPDEHPNDPTDGSRLAAEVRALRRELSHLREHRMVMLYQSVPRVIFFRFLTGMAIGLGTAVGATLLLSVIIWSLTQIEFIPIIGEWAVSIAQEIETLTGGSMTGGGTPEGSE